MEQLKHYKHFEQQNNITMKHLFLAILILVSQSIFAQEFNKEKMDSLFDAIAQNDKGMGSISLYKDGKEMYARAIGFADVENGVEAGIHTKYRIGSISKTFTATIVMKLVEQEKLSLSTPLSIFFPEFKNADKITIEMLLRHRSGIFNFTNAEDYTSWMEKPISKKDLVDKMVKYGVDFEPDSRSDYSNSNYVLLTFIAEIVEGKLFNEMLQDIICKPCKLENTYYGGKINVKNNEAKSYLSLNGWQPATETDMTVPAGAGAIVSTASDLNRFLDCLFNHKILSASTVKQMMEIKDQYGLGMFTAPFYERKAYGHTGGIDGFQSRAFYFLDDKVSISYVSNGVFLPLNDVLIGALSIYFGREYTIPDFVPAALLSPEEMQAFTGVYSTTSFPLKLTIFLEGSKLLGQGTGQPAFPLEATGPKMFKYEPAGLTIEFDPENSMLILKQSGMRFEMKKE